MSVQADGLVAESVEIAASPDAVYAVVTDVAGLPRWAAETVGCRWVGGATGAAVGARFRGANRRGPVRWSTTCTVTAADPGRTFAFGVTGFAGIPVSEWRYDIEPVGDGCRVTESWRDLRPLAARLVGGVAIGVLDRPAHNRANMRRTLAALKRHLEPGG
jgi:hypothetical protein